MVVKKFFKNFSKKTEPIAVFVRLISERARERLKILEKKTNQNKRRKTPWQEKKRKK